VTRLHRFVELVHEPAEQLLAQLDPPALLLYEAAPQEALPLGWLIGGFPKRYRTEDALVVTYPRGHGPSAAGLRERYADRSCWYYRIDPTRLAPDLRRCEDAQSLLDRPQLVDGPPLMLQPTALRRQLLELGPEPTRRPPPASNEPP
jgi:hypothetical protein